MKKDISKIRKLEKEIELLVNDKNSNVNDLQELFLDKLLQILDIADKIYEGKESDYISDYKLKVLKRYECIFNGEKDIKDIDELLDMFLESLENKLSKNSIKLDYDIYPSQKRISKGEGNGKFEDEKECVDKYRVFLNILMNKGINLDDIIIFEEELNEKRMRRFPYRIIYISEGKINKTILISDEIGQATFVYDGIIKVENFRKVEKGEEIDGLPSKRIIYGTNYSIRLEKNIFLEENEEISDEFKIGISEDIKGEVKLKNIVEWQNFVYSEKEQLEKEAKLYEKDGVWYFSSIKGNKNWKYLTSFPSGLFNRENGLGENNGFISSGGYLKEMFEFIGLRVANKEEEKEYYLERNKEEWQKYIYSKKDQLEKDAELYEKDGVWYFNDIKSNRKWGYLGSFPNRPFNRENGLGDNEGFITSGDYLKGMFEFIGLRVATKEEELKYYLEKNREEWHEFIYSKKEQLEKEAKLHEKNGVWYFRDINGAKNWKYLLYFPSSNFNKEHGLGGNDGIITNGDYLKEMFEFIGLRVASEKEELKRMNKEWL